MTSIDFPTWYSAGAYGGLLFALGAAAAVAGLALRGHRGTLRQVSVAVLACLVAACMTLAAIWWNLNRLELYGPSLAASEVGFWLVWIATLGWGVPLLSAAGFALFAVPTGVAQGGAASWPPGNPGERGAGGAEALAALGDPARHVEPLGPGQAWGRLVALDGAYVGRASLLTRQLTLVGRETDNDLVLEDERTSRHHAEFHWDHGHAQLVDRHSTNGTLVNRQLVRGIVPLREGDVIELGSQRYRFELVSPGEQSAVVDAFPLPDTSKMAGIPTVALRFDGEPLVLVALSGPEVGRRWMLGAGITTTTIGRDAARDICLHHTSISRLHAQIVRQRSGFFVSDLQSSNGTLLNGQPLAAPTMLTPGDVLRVGEIELRCEAAMASGEAQADAPLPRAARRQSAVTTPPAARFSHMSGPRTGARARLGPPRLTPSDPPASEGDAQG
ncbi:MAG TPA: FHA domain-containing protein [Ktedonobacterales bacterium]|nr:FHA domain-containing protein [Ktedonobacterales bacterium]